MDTREQFLLDKLDNGGLNDYDRDLYQAELDQIVANRKQRVAIVTGAAEPGSSFSLTVDGYTVDFRTEAASEESYQALSIVTQLKIQEIEESKNAIKSSYESDIRQLELQVSNAHSHNKTLDDEIAELKNEVVISNLRDANNIAALELAQQEAEAYKKQYEELRDQVSKPNIPTNQDTGALAEAMNKLKASKPAIYNVTEISGTKATGILVDTNKTIDFHPNYIGKYRVVSYDEAMQIIAEREVAAATELENTPSNDIPDEPATPLPIPKIPNADSGDSVVGDEPVPESTANNEGYETIVTDKTLEIRLKQIKEEIKGEIVKEYRLQRFEDVA